MDLIEQYKSDDENEISEKQPIPEEILCHICKEAEHKYKCPGC